MAVVLMYQPISYFLIGDFRRALGEMSPAMEATHQCSSVSITFQRTVLRLFEVSILAFLGDFERFRQLFDRELRDQLERGIPRVPFSCRSFLVPTNWNWPPTSPRSAANDSGRHRPLGSEWVWLVAPIRVVGRD